MKDWMNDKRKKIEWKKKVSKLTEKNKVTTKYHSEDWLVLLFLKTVQFVYAVWCREENKGIGKILKFHLKKNKIKVNLVSVFNFFN